MRALPVLLALLLAPVAVAAGMSDPTRPQDAAIPQKSAANDAPSFRLQYVAVGPSGASAIINGARVRVGDRVSGARVLSIQSGRVALQHAGERIVLRLDHSSIRRKRGRQ